MIKRCILVGVLCGASAFAGKKSNEVIVNSDRGTPPVSHRFLKAGWKSKGAAVIGKDFSITWTDGKNDELSDSWMLKDGSISCSFSDRKKKLAGIRFYGPDKKLKWTYTVDKGRDNHSCQPLPGGRFLAGESVKGGAYMVEIDSSGNKVKEIELELSPALQAKAGDIHHMFRSVRKTPTGTYLAACMKYNKAVEWDASGKQVNEFPDCNFTAVRLANGNTLVSGRKGVLEYDGSKNIVWSMTAKDFTALNLRIQMICGIQRLPNGNTIITNVNHGNITKKGDLYKVIEVTPKKELVWWVDNPNFSGMNLGSVQAIDIEGDAANFGVWK